MDDQTESLDTEVARTYKLSRNLVVGEQFDLSKNGPSDDCDMFLQTSDGMGNVCYNIPADTVVCIFFERLH